MGWDGVGWDMDVMLILYDIIWRCGVSIEPVEYGRKMFAIEITSMSQALRSSSPNSRVGKYISFFSDHLSRLR